MFKEYHGYQGKKSEVESGLATTVVTIQEYSSPAYIIKVTVTQGTLVHTYIAKYKNNNIYMLTNKSDDSVHTPYSSIRAQAHILTDLSHTLHCPNRSQNPA